MSGGHGIRPGQFSQLWHRHNFRTQVSPFQQFPKLRMLLGIAGCCGLLGIVLCAVCAQFSTRGSWMVMPLVLMPVMASMLSSEGMASYCRFSSKKQDDRTIADQQRQCWERATRRLAEIFRTTHGVRHSPSARRRVVADASRVANEFVRQSGKITVDFRKSESPKKHHGAEHC